MMDLASKHLSLDKLFQGLGRRSGIAARSWW
jgi:hypothetical protein